MNLRVGLIVNPIAGLGGSAGFKGSDSQWRQALDGGAIPQAQVRALRFVERCTDVDWLTVPGAMGLPDLPTIEGTQTILGHTSADDTADAARKLIAAGVDLLCFVGGDGTAADIAAAVEHRLPVLGIPGGVKITSPVFAHDPLEAAWLVSRLTPGFETVAKDVTDLDEAAYQSGRLDVVLKGSLLVPMSPVMQGGKAPLPSETPLEPLVEEVIKQWDSAAMHLVGAGSVCRAVKAQFWGEPTLLGVDAIRGDKIVGQDLNGRELEDLIEPGAHLWLSIIGGQGMLLGRGTQILTPTVLKRIGWDNIHVVAPQEKLLGLRQLYVDSGDPEFDASAPNYIRVISGWNETRMIRIAHGPPDS